VKFTLSWLKQHLETDAGLDEILERLTMVGLEVEKVTDRAAGLRSFVVARIAKARPHPDADRLRICTVETGSETVEVVCGAPNARTGMLGVFAASGAYIPGAGITLKPTEIRGVASNGMLLSEREMSLSDDHNGIIDLPEDSPIGAAAVTVMGLDDPIIQIAITPNRGDCLGVRGIARDIAASGIGVLKPLDATPVSGAYASPIKVHLKFDAATRKACPYFIGRYVRGVKNGNSPQWVKDKLLAIGLRPISALVDITNLMTFDLGRPLHVFDASKITGHIRPRLARAGESLAALDGKTYALDETMTVIADDSGPKGLGGVIGGEASSCTEKTTAVFIESAYFDPIRTATTGRKLNILSDARYRFERGVDPAFLADGMEIATRLVLELCGGEASEIVVAGAEPNWRRDISLRAERIGSLAGVDVAADDIARILAALGFTATPKAGGFSVAIPSWRDDIVGEACLVEEVVRIFGYDKIQAIPLLNTDPLPDPAYSPVLQRRSAVRRLLAGRGLVEAVTYSFLRASDAALFGEVSEAVKLVNPISADLDVMRPSLLPNLIAAAARNGTRGLTDILLFEVGPVFAGDKPEEQSVVAAAIRCGITGPRHWCAVSRPWDAFDAKADAEAVLADLGVTVQRLQTTTDAPPWYHPGRSGVLRQGPNNLLAQFGEIHPRVLRSMGAAGPIVAIEVFLDNLAPPKARKLVTRSQLNLASLQKVERDLAFVVSADISADLVVAAARTADKILIKEVRVFDVFSGGNLKADQKSMAITVVLQPRDRTLTDVEIDDVTGRVIDKVARKTGATLRS